MTWREELQAIFEGAVAEARFSVPNVYKAAQQALYLDNIARAQWGGIELALGTKVATHILQGVVRAAFLIELVLEPKIETTKFEVRWATRLKSTDPRNASYLDCLAIFEHVLSELRAAVEIEAQRDLLKLFYEHKLIPYEIPLDYITRVASGQMHRADNIAWFFDDLPRKVIKLRAFLLDRHANKYGQIFTAAYDKIKVKTYLTDRVLTGDHKTNREKRWEVHPGSVHFALRRNCLDVEYALINQLCHFDGVPEDFIRAIEQRGLIIPLKKQESVGDQVARCPITLDRLSFRQFETEMSSPEHGKSNFQVGHLNPLKAINDNPQVGHTAENIAWISADGNRIQGSLSLRETRALIQRIYVNYRQAGTDWFEME